MYKIESAIGCVNIGNFGGIFCNLKLRERMTTRGFVYKNLSLCEQLKGDINHLHSGLKIRRDRTQSSVLGSILIIFTLFFLLIPNKGGGEILFLLHLAAAKILG